MSRMKPEVLEDFLRQPYIGVIATLRRDGRPYTVEDSLRRYPL